MKKQIMNGSLEEKRLLNIKEVSIYIGRGQVSARQYMDEIGATRKFGRRVLFDKTVIDEALDKMGE